MDVFSMKLVYFLFIIACFVSLQAGEGLYLSDSDSGEALSALMARIASRTPSPQPLEISSTSSTATSSINTFSDTKPKKTVHFQEKVTYRIIHKDKEARLQESEEYEEGTEKLSISSLLSLNLVPLRFTSENELFMPESHILGTTESLLSNSNSDSESEEDDYASGQRTTTSITFKRN